jgi:transcriptional regulator with XRE-family HTH domain
MYPNKRLRVKSRVLRELREAKGWTGQMAAAQIGISHQTLGYLERGVSRRPHRLTLEQIARVYGVTLAEIAS